MRERFVIINQLFCLDSLDIIRQINDQTCPYFKYYPIEKKVNRIDEIVLDIDQHANRYFASFSSSRIFYQFKPYE